MSLASTSMIWNGQGPVMIGTYDPVKGRPEMGFLTNLYSVGCGNRTLTATPARETTTIPESCSGQRLALKELETAGYIIRHQLRGKGRPHHRHRVHHL